jgi:succinate dehydrogenase / fumarate reductase cytochrome b subunit
MKLSLRPVRSSVGSKYVMALTGLALIGFVLGHLGGNLLIYAGPDALNSYAHALKARPPLLWAARLGLLAIFLVHVALGARLTLQNTAARGPVRYFRERAVRASWAARHMMLTGLVLLAFLVYHLAHFTLGVVTRADVQVTATGAPVEVNKNYLDLAEVRTKSQKYEARPELDLGRLRELGSDREDARQDVYSMVIAGFRNRWVSLSYLVAMAFLGLHLWHGGSSWLQSLGLNGRRWAKVTEWVGPVLAVVVVAGNCSIPLAVLAGFVP